jgi:hypothetical protein
LNILLKSLKNSLLFNKAVIDLITVFICSKMLYNYCLSMREIYSCIDLSNYIQLLTFNEVYSWLYGPGQWSIDRFQRPRLINHWPGPIWKNVCDPFQQHKFGGWHIQNTIRSKALGVFYRKYDKHSWRRIVFMFLETSHFHYGWKVPTVTITVFITILEQNR